MYHFIAYFAISPSKHEFDLMISMQWKAGRVVTPQLLNLLKNLMRKEFI